MYGSSRTIMKEVKKKVTAVVLTTAIGVTSVSALADFDKETSNTDVNETNITEVTATPETVNEPTASPTIEPTTSPTIEPTVTPTDDNSESTLTQNDDKAPFEDLNNNNPLNEYVSDDDFGISLFSGKETYDSGNIPYAMDFSYTYDEGTLYIYGSGAFPSNMPSSTYWTNSSNVKFSAGTVTDIIFEDGITKIYEPVLKPFKNVVNVKLPSTLTFLAEKAFAGCSNLETINIPDGITSIYGYTFNNCRKLNNIKLPEGLTYIDDRAFYGCSSLTDLTLPSTLKTINELAFSNGPRFKNNELTIPKGVTTITSRSFENIKDLKTINVENGVTTIEKYAFADNDSLTRVNLPSSITSVANTACKYYNEEKYSTCDIYIDKYKDSIPCYSNWGTTGTIYWKARDFKNTTDNTVVISDVADQTYTGSLIAPNITVSCNDVELVKDTDYTVSYSNNKNVGTATISITGIGDYTGTITKNFNIVARDISDTTIGSIPNQTYTGNSISVLPVITYNGATLTKGTDYTLTYSNNVNVGTGTVTITGKGNFTGTTSKNFTIKDFTPDSSNPISLNSDKLKINWDNTSYVYDGNEKKPKPTSIRYYFNDVYSYSLIEGQDFSLSYANNTDAGTGTVTVNGVGGFSNSKSNNFTITSASINNAVFTDIETAEFSGGKLYPNFTVTVDGRELVKNTDYTVEYSNNVQVGTGNIKITGIDNYTGVAETTFTIEPYDPQRHDKDPVDMSTLHPTITGTFTYNKAEQKPVPTIVYQKYNNETLTMLEYTLVEGKDYNLTYTNNINAGTATLTATGIGVFKGYCEKDFTINPKSAESLSIDTIGDKVFSGVAQTPDAVIKDVD